jgi:chromate transporter
MPSNDGTKMESQPPDRGHAALKALRAIARSCDQTIGWNRIGFLISIAIIAIAAYKLARGTNKRNPLLWGIFAVLTVVTVWAQTELAEFFILAGLIVLVFQAWPGWKPGILMVLSCVALGAAIGLMESWLGQAGTGGNSGHVLTEILLFFTKAGAFVFGSGLAIIPFLHQGVVQQFGWLNEHQFLDAVAVAMITPGPVVITVAFIGYLVAGLAGAVMASIGIFLPVYVFTVVPAPWFKRHRGTQVIKNRPMMTARVCL